MGGNLPAVQCEARGRVRAQRAIQVFQIVATDLREGPIVSGKRAYDPLPFFLAVPGRGARRGGGATNELEKHPTRGPLCSSGYCVSEARSKQQSRAISLIDSARIVRHYPTYVVQSVRRTRRLVVLSAPVHRRGMTVVR